MPNRQEACVLKLSCDIVGGLAASTGSSPGATVMLLWASVGCLPASCLLGLVRGIRLGTRCKDNGLTNIFARAELVLTR
eukprot:898496-Amphidinium_carterae.1